ncbi:MAG: hypothetical protein ACRETO_03220 [Gammaproteobacteria bacterium]
MDYETCRWILCFAPIQVGRGTKIFEFSDFLTALALLGVIYTITDVRYKFRIAIAPGELHSRTFVLFAAIGIGSLLTGLWPAMGWWVPETFGLSQVMLQTIWAILFFTAVFTWMWYAFIHPPIFGRSNARRYLDVMVSYMVRGNDDELKVIASELGRSAEQLVRYARQIPEVRIAQQAGRKYKSTDRGYCAYQVFLLIGNRKLCKQIVRSAPATAKYLFDAVIKTGKYHLPLAQFARNISGEAINWEESFLYDEADGFQSGLLGYIKPITKAVYGNIRLIEALASQVGSPLDVFYKDQLSWNSRQWEAYCRAVLIALEDCLKQGSTDGTYGVFSRAIEDLKTAFRDIGSINGVTDSYDTDAYQKMHVIAQFVTDASELLNNTPNRPEPFNRVRESTYPKNIYDNLAGLVLDMCVASSAVTEPFFTSWMVQYNTVWNAVFGTENGPVWHILRHKVMRLLYDEIATMSRIPNYKGARILGFCLNVLGVSHGARPARGRYGRDAWPLAIAAQAWCKKNYLTMREELPDVADAVLTGSITFDEPNNRLVKTYAKGLHREAPQSFMDLDAARPSAEADLTRPD